MDLYHFFVPEGTVIWITGLSGSGKTTIATELVSQLRLLGQHSLLLDGDELRNTFASHSFDSQANYDRTSRLQLALSYCRLARLTSRQGVFTIVATISMFDEVYTWNRNHLSSYYEVYLKPPLELLKERDPKSLYKSYFSGDISNMAGLDLPVDEPKEPHLVIESFGTPYSIAQSILTKSSEFLK